MDLYQSLVTVNPVTLIGQICNLFITLAVVKIFFLDKIKAIALNAIKRGAKDFAFKCSTPEVYAEAKRRLLEEDKDIHLVLKELKKQNKSLNTDSCSIANSNDLYILIVYLKS